MLETGAEYFMLFYVMLFYFILHSARRLSVFQLVMRNRDELWCMTISILACSFLWKPFQ